MPTIRRTALFALLAAAGLSLAACENTVRGAGEDIENVGEAAQDAAS